MTWELPIYILAVYGLIRYLAKPKTDLPAGKINWGPLESISLAVGIYFGAQLAAGLIMYAYGSLTGAADGSLSGWLESSTGAQFFFILLIEALTIGALYKFLKRRRSNFKALGLIKPRWIDIAYALTGFAIYFVGFLVFIMLVQQLVPSLDINQEQEVGFDNARGGGLVLVFISLVILPPLVEEILMRGFLYSGLRRKLPLIYAALITSALFAVAHLQAGNSTPLVWIAALDTFVLSLVLIGLREKSGSLWPPIGLHMLKNSIAFVALFVITS